MHLCTSAASVYRIGTAQAVTFSVTGPTPTPPPTGVEQVAIDYSYDPLYRLTRATYSGNLAASYAYSYDAVGNRLTQDANGTRTTYTYDSANRLTSVNGQPYTWDNNGNLTSDGLLTYSYDQANRLKQVTQGANTYTFAYNGLGDRLSQTIGITTTRYVLDPAAGLTQVLSDGTNTYLYGNGRIAQYQAEMQYFGADGLGSVRQLYDATGQVLANTRYDPYGNVMSQYGEATSVFGYTGEQWDTATGLEYLRARYYSPAQGRFFQQDLWPGDDLRPQSLNAYSYVRNNSVRFTDPTGQCDPDECTWTPDGNAGWAITDTGNEIMSGKPRLDRTGLFSDERRPSNLDPRWGTYILRGTPSAPYWTLPTREQAWVQWQCSRGFCLYATSPFNSLSRALDMLLNDKGGRYGNFRYRTQRTFDECEANLYSLGTGMALMTAAPMSVRPAPDYFVTPDGVALPAPKGAVGPFPSNTGRGLVWEGPGGKGTQLDKRVTGIRLMDPTKQYPEGYNSYYNITRQPVNPITGKTMAKNDPWWHIPNIGFKWPGSP